MEARRRHAPAPGPVAHREAVHVVALVADTDPTGHVPLLVDVAGERARRVVVLTQDVRGQDCVEGDVERAVRGART